MTAIAVIGPVTRLRRVTTVPTSHNSFTRQNSVFGNERTGVIRSNAVALDVAVSISRAMFHISAEVLWHQRAMRSWSQQPQGLMFDARPDLRSTEGHTCARPQGHSCARPRGCSCASNQLHIFRFPARSCDSGADTDPRFYLDRPAPVYHHDLEALIWIFVWVMCCYDGGLAVDCHDGQPRLNPLPQPFAEWMLRGDSHEFVVSADSHKLLASARRCLESKESFLSTVTMWNGREPATVWGAPAPTWGAPIPTWGAPLPIRDLLFAMPAKPSTIWTAASAMWEIAGPTRTMPADELDVAVTPYALALCMLSYTTGRIGERSLAFARSRSQGCMEDRWPRMERDDCSEKNAEGDLRSHYVKNASGMARKDDALGKTSADDPGKVWIDFEDKISKCVMVQDDSFRSVLNDWDLAGDPSDTARTTPLMPCGTPPFMAVDMLEEDALKGKVQRLYRHDLESLFYVLTWAACCYKDGRRLDPLPRMFEKWALGSLSIRPQDFMARLLAYEDPHPLQTCRDSKFSFIAGGRQWREDIPWRELGYIAEGLRFFFMGEETARWAVWDRPAGRAIQMAEFMALIEGREPPPRPQEADEPEKMWEGFCAAVREVIEDIMIMCKLLHCAGRHEYSLWDGLQAARDRHPRLRPVAIPPMDVSSQITAGAVLNDWDFAPPFASRASGPAADPRLPPPATDPRLPSLPSPPSITFAAIDVLQYAFTGEAERPYRHEVEHLYRHDLEAFIWVFTWVACCVEDGRQLDPLPERFQDWVSGIVKRMQGLPRHGRQKAGSRMPCDSI
ncbi:uncharacterized protein SCHCODRAFT_02573300 [Schizophyllum commune H4-8]|uniref:Fungal-type protein kinase domain-containing protein n=1 Tax=Schizophyllum commune (strain H4-8 / FGSC 9210) TaxID=578458 RepID=D8Q1S7_SCHCM|nr:uncharacterized protein SCHCODRAFT_02573300 [Schizophyllum commune H4-8]KAI5895551.1 hypothetical protein SCHCODRAFT_02573300 [Schizophyllum commune H4-8]